MVRWVIGSILHGVDPLTYFWFQPVLHDWSTKAVVCDILSVGWCIYKITLAVISERVAHVAAAGFLSHYLSGPLPYVQHHITVNKMC